MQAARTYFALAFAKKQEKWGFFSERLDFIGRVWYDKRSLTDVRQR